jgi:hypothetical protein
MDECKEMKRAPAPCHDGVSNVSYGGTRSCASGFFGPKLGTRKSASLRNFEDLGESGAAAPHFKTQATELTGL